MKLKIDKKITESSIALTQPVLNPSLESSFLRIFTLNNNPPIVTPSNKE